MIEEKITVKKAFDVFDDVESFDRKNDEHAKLLDLYNSMPIIVPKSGEVLSGVYQGISSNQFVFTSVGLKDDIRVDNKPYELKYLESLNIGDSLDLLITDVNEEQYMIKGSISQVYESRAHEVLKEIDSNEYVIAVVNSLNPAGYNIEIIKDGVSLPGFMPNTLAGINRLYEPESILHHEFEVMIESFSESEGTYIVSRKRYLQSLIHEEASKLVYGDVYTGSVTGTTPFGVFVEFSTCDSIPRSLTAMIHKDNLREDWQDRIKEIVPGFEVQFYIKEVIKERGNRFKIILTQILRESLWDSIEVGQMFEGVVKDVKKFGTLVSLDEETVGLIHTSELEKINKKFEKGDTIKVKVLSMDRTSRKISLTSK